MTDARRRSRLGIIVGLLAALGLIGGLVGMFLYLRSLSDRGPGPGDPAYREMVSAFFAGVAALDVDANDNARRKLDRAIDLFPDEPAAWADRGLLAIRLGDLGAAGRDLVQARTLAPDSGSIEAMLGLLESRRGRFAEAIAHFTRAVELDPSDLKTRYTLAQESERQGGPDAESNALEALAKLGERAPGNLVVLLDRARLASKLGDVAALRAVVERLGTIADRWPDRVQERYRAVAEAVGGDPRALATRLAFLRNVLLPEPGFRRDLSALQDPPGVIGEPITRFLKLPAPPPIPAPADHGLAYAIRPLAGRFEGRWTGLAVLGPTDDAPPVVLLTDGKTLRRAYGQGPDLSFPGGPDGEPPTPDGILALDIDSDERLDLVLAGAGGVRIALQRDDGTFADVTDAANLEASIAGAACRGAWAADIEADGDLDVVLGLRDGPPTVLRNNADGSFAIVRPFDGVTDLRAFACADFDRDGDLDAALVDGAGALAVFANERVGEFVRRTGPDLPWTTVALAVADANMDGGLDLLALDDEGTVRRISDSDGGRGWSVAELIRAPSNERPVRLFAADLDNNGGVDLLISGIEGARAWLSNEAGALVPLGKGVAFGVADVVDLDGDGLLDLAGLDSQGGAVAGTAGGTKGYRWQVLRPRAARVFGDGRINAFGLGGEVQVRAGLLVQTLPIAGPSVHFGLGEHPTADVVRIVWPNGTTQAEFDTKADAVVVAEQRLKGSCPFLFAFDGEGLKFVTDLIWRSPLGLRINAQDIAGVTLTEDWVKVRGDQLAPRDGQYDLRITADLWETHFFDLAKLLVVDHPIGTEVFVDERFARDPPPLTVRTTGPPIPIARATDDRGLDATAVLLYRDGQYLDTFGRGPYQGITRDHWVEIELRDETPRDQPLVLIAQGWVHPTDSSLNVAIAQGRHDPPRGLALEVANPDGSWTVARPDLGFPAGKHKTILVDLDGLFSEETPRKLRLRTNLEVFWDAVYVAVDDDLAPHTQLRLDPRSADLRYRGISLMTQAGPGSPELAEYDQLVSKGQRWRDLAGYYTRFGDVRELLDEVDDRYVILNAGDEIALRFDDPGPPDEGFVRDFIFVADGWVKDGDFNTSASRTVLPLPSHDRPEYDHPAGPLEDDPVFRAQPGDWIEYHTRYVAPDLFSAGLRSRLPARSGGPLETR